ncbi:DUF5954 family protein [Streptomyces sp. HC307]|uniref:DUF5954 family protein n=1 Tax=Streptomyces flavusporus TaxID=3385496 RepID=UPI0039172D0E
MIPGWLPPPGDPCVSLPTTNHAREYETGGGELLSSGDETPQAARDSLAAWLRVMAPFRLRLGEEERAEYARLADRLDEPRCNVLAVAGVPYRVARVERLIRIGPDGPEPRTAGGVEEALVGVRGKGCRSRVGNVGGRGGRHYQVTRVTGVIYTDWPCQVNSLCFLSS